MTLGFKGLIRVNWPVGAMFFLLQRARLARVQMNNKTVLTNFIDSRRRAVETSFEPLTEFDENNTAEDTRERSMFHHRHHHLLSCLEQTTVSNCKLSLSKVRTLIPHTCQIATFFKSYQIGFISGNMAQKTSRETVNIKRRQTDRQT